MTGAVLAAMVLAAGGAVGCEQAAGRQPALNAPERTASAVWSPALSAAGDDALQQELQSATAVRAQATLPQPDAVPTADALSEPDRVGMLFVGGTQICTASVVDSPGHDLLITAAHCIHGGRRGE